jgi:hypothetical protein
MMARRTTYRNPAKFDRCVKDVKRRGGAANAYAVCTAAGTRNKGKRKRNPPNPADAAASMSERFHGRPVIEVKEVIEGVHYHTHLAELGELELLKVRALDGIIVRLEDFSGALLCSNEDGTQLFIRGGDQSVDPEEFGVEEPFHDKEELGEVIEVRYYTTKDHLGDDGGEATYYHEFGEDDKEEGRKPRRPRLHYSVRDSRLSFAGGGYRVEAEGIVN